jgi:hypothetical protein
MHDECAQKYKFKYIDKLPDPVGAPAEFGKIFEEIVYQRWNNGRDWHCADAQPRVDELYKNEKKSPPNIEAMMKALFTHQAIIDFPKAKAFQVKIDVPCGQTRLFGFLDIHQEDNVIIDVKTAGKPWDDKKIAGTEQHIAYPFGMLRAGRIPPVFPIIFKFVIVTTSVNPQVQIITFKLSEDALKKYERKFDERLTKIKLEMELGMFPANRGVHCNWCPYKNMCPAWR